MSGKIFLLLLALSLYHLGLSQDSGTINKGTIKIVKRQIMVANKIDNLNNTAPYPFIMDTTTNKAANTKVPGNELRKLTVYPHSDTVTISALLKDPEVKLVGCPECKVISYETFIYLNGKGITLTCNSGRFTEKMIKEIKKLSFGTSIVIGDVHIQCPANSNETLPGKQLIIGNKD